MDKSLKNIRLYDFRHYFATRFYMFYKDPFKLKEYMGQKKFETTEIYTKLVGFPEKPKYVTSSASTEEEISELGEAGWDEYSVLKIGEREVHL
ncbi:MAG: hypothetical protein ACETWE_07560 [Candidatus Bathyarchaeia archaeon]